MSWQIPQKQKHISLGSPKATQVRFTLLFTKFDFKFRKRRIFIFGGPKWPAENDSQDKKLAVGNLDCIVEEEDFNLDNHD